MAVRVIQKNSFGREESEGKDTPSMKAAENYIFSLSKVALRAIIICSIRAQKVGKDSSTIIQL